MDFNFNITYNRSMKDKTKTYKTCEIQVTPFDLIYKELDFMMFLSKNLYNTCLFTERQCFFEKRDCQDHVLKNKMKGFISNLSYEQVQIESNSVIYCDPPYMDTTCSQYKCVFDHDRFHRFALEHDAFVSEVSVPDGFRIVWSKKLYNKVSGKGNERRKELLLLPMKTKIMNSLEW